MPLERRRTSFGINMMTALNKETGKPYGTIKVLGGVSGDMTRDTMDLHGGTNPHPFDSEPGNVNPELSLRVKEFHPMLYELAGYTRTDIASNVGGEVSSAIANKNGTSAVDATTGMASVSKVSGKDKDVKDGYYIVEVVSATTVHVYSAFDNEFDLDKSSDKSATALSYQNDLLRITETALTIPGTGGTVEIPGTGIEITGGSGAIAMTIGDTAIFETRSQNDGGYQLTYGESPEPIEFHMVLTSGTKSNGEFVREHWYRVKLQNVPGGMDEKAWKEADITVKVLYDQERGKLFDRFDIKKEAYTIQV